MTAKKGDKNTRSSSKHEEAVIHGLKILKMRNVTFKKIKKKKWLGAILMLLLFLHILPSFTAKADVEYYEKWPEYEAANNIQNVTWNNVADAMDQVLDAAIEAYEKGDSKAAYDRINNAYYGYYEITGFERVAMGYIPGGRKSQMELQFSNCKSVAKKNGSLDDFKKEVETLRSMLHEDANVLDGVSDTSAKEDEKETKATNLFASKYYPKWPEYETDSGITSPTWNDVTDAMVEVLKKGKEAFRAGDLKAAYDYVNDAYYGYYEITGFERVAMGYIPGGRKSQMELQFSNCKSVAKKNGSLEDYEKEVDTLMSMLREDAHVLDGTTPEESGSASSGGNRSAGAATFIACFTIILREGFEAILVVGAIVAYLVKAKGEKDDRIRKKMVRPVYIGAILGIGASFLSALILNQLKLANSASQEIIEGVTALIAVAVLYWVSNWMLSKSESEAWSTYIRNKVEKSSKNGSVFALAFTAFLAVYREGAEVILFFQPMIAGGNLNMVWGGFIVGCVALVFVFLAIRFLSIKIPLKPFFIATSILMFIMAFAFLGSGIKELIEGDVITATMPAWLSWIPMGSEGIASFLDILGIYPIVETFIPQMILVGVTIVIFIWHLKRNKKLREASRSVQEA